MGTGLDARDALAEGSPDGPPGADAGDAGCLTIDAALGPAMVCPSVEAGVCAPTPLPDAAFPWHPPGQILAACTSSQIFGLVNDCLGDMSTNAACSAFLSSDGGLTCANCTISSTTTPLYGPLIGTGGVVTLNIAGCFALQNPCSVPCASLHEALFQCQTAACTAACVGDAGSASDEQLNALASCETSATSCVCSPENAGVVACEPALMADPRTAACIFPSSTTFNQRAESLISLFCGNGTMDAGSP
jgi:hypothetical protein